MGTPGSDDTFLFDGFRFDRKAGGLFRLDRAGNVAPVPLGSRTLDLLGLLARHRGEAVSKDRIFSEVWSGRAVEEANLNVQISKLRHILDEGRAQGSCIQTITGYGYRFVEGPATEAPPPSTAAGGDNGAPAQAVTVTRPPGFRESPAGVAPQRPLSPRAMRCGAALSALGIVVLLMTSVDWSISWLRASRPEAPPQSIVVLPFADLSDDQKQRNLADGIVQDLTTDLSRAEQITVIARSTAAAYGQKSPDSRTIGRELGVRYVLEGSVEGTGDRVRVAAQLSDAKTAANLWADRFDGGAGNRLGFQDEITGRIAAALGPAMVTADAARVVDHPGLLDFILRGRALMMRTATAENRVAAIAEFERALALDQRSIIALTWLARALASGGPGVTTPSDIVSAKDLVERALTEAPGSLLAHYARGALLRAQYRFEDAIPEYQMAVEQDPDWPDAYANLGQAKVYTGAVPEGLALVERAVRLDPGDPLVGIWYARIGLGYLLLSRIDDAIYWLDKARIADPSLPYVYARLAAAEALKGDSERAKTALAEARTRSANGQYASIDRLRAESLGSPKIRALYDAVYFPGLRLAGVPDK